MKDCNLIFNIFFIPETVAYQSIALVSLLLNTKFKFCLVGNALSDDEADLLEKIAQTSDRLKYANFHSDTIIPHGTLIDLMFLHESSSHYCFADSDVFLFEPFKKSALELLGDADVFSTGSRIENAENTEYAGFKGGATTTSPDGQMDLATSFFCIYRRAPLEHIKYKYGVGFEQYRSVLEVPEPVKPVIKGLEFDMFDTGKLLSVLLHQENYKKRNQAIDGFYHIGGMSGRYLQDINLNNEQMFDDETLDAMTPVVKQQKYKTRDDYEIKLKRFYGSYFYVYLNSLIGQAHKPRLKSQNREVKSLINKLETYIEKLLVQANKLDETKAIMSLIGCNKTDG